MANVFDIANETNRNRVMRKAVETLRAAATRDAELCFPWFVVLVVCIEGLARPRKTKEPDDLRNYLEANFQSLCEAVPAADFVKHMRNKAFHEFAPRPPYAIRRDDPDASYVVESDGWQCLNLDRLSRDVLAHLDALGA